ncbi:MAG: YbjQ family protein [Lysobacterales bacterium]|nr:YbjQ family protein [Xanthomonadales bacterium]MCB1612769.1 YbjQ family protein [Xanthomonadales bacterium]
MKITTQDEFAEHQIVATLGMVTGNTIRSRHIGKDILAGLRTLVGGEITEYTKMMAEAREQALDRMKMHAKRLQADGIVCVRFTTSPIMAGAAELLAYGTAVKLAPRGSQPPPMKPAEPVKVPAASGESGNFMLERG